MIQIDMPMPENCRECPLMASVDEYSYFCALTKEKIGNWFEECMPFKTAPYSNERRPDCPLREVKDYWPVAEEAGAVDGRK